MHFYNVCLVVPSINDLSNYMQFFEFSFSLVPDFGSSGFGVPYCIVFLNFSYVIFYYLPQMFLGNILWVFPQCSPGCWKEDFSASGKLLLFCIFEDAWRKPVQEPIVFLRMFWGGNFATWVTAKNSDYSYVPLLKYLHVIFQIIMLSRFNYIFKL